jgi:hypothetical protein
MRRIINLDRSQLIELLAGITDPANAACRAELTAGARFRVHDSTVSRESVLRVYAARLPTASTHEVLRRLAHCAYPHLRLSAVSGHGRYVVFLDPDARHVIACLQVTRS